MKNSLVWFLLFSLTINLVACNPKEAITNPTQGLTPEPLPAIKPEFTADTGAFKVQLVFAEDGSPMAGFSFYLARWLPVPNMPEAGVPELDLATSPRGDSDKNGILVISNVPPDRYSLILYTPLNVMIVPNAESPVDVWAEIKPNEVTDLGTIKVQLYKDDYQQFAVP